MLKYYYHNILTKEIPDELSLGIFFTGCNINCPDCHSPHLWEDTGDILNEESLSNLIASNNYISCILFMGGEWKDESLFKLASTINKKEYKLALYSGHDLDYCLKLQTTSLLDYLKVGHYDPLLGGLDYPSTNQKLYKINNEQLEDITYKFWNTNIR